MKEYKNSIKREREQLYFRFLSFFFPFMIHSNKISKNLNSHNSKDNLQTSSIQTSRSYSKFMYIPKIHLVLDL